MDICFFGGYDSDYPRNSILRRGLKANDVPVFEAHIRRGHKFWVRYPLLVLRWLRHGRRRAALPSLLFIPEFCQKDVFLARAIAGLFSKRIVFDPLASRYETKVLDWQRKPEGSLAAWWNRLIDRLAFKSSDLVLADTEAHKKYYCREFGVSPWKVAVMPVGFDDRVFTQSLAQRRKLSCQRESPFTVLFFGSFLPLHGVETAAEAAFHVWKKDKTVRFTFIGSGQTYPRTRKMASDFGLTNISFEGWINQVALAEKIASEADICLGIFGRTEKASRVVPHKIFQAMALRKPVITGRTPAAREFFTHGKDIYFCPAGDPESLARAILELREDVAHRDEIARGGYELAWQRFTPQRLGSRLREILAGRFLA
ncbi:MAG: glycosyltransferase [Clostridiales bacterium]|nr:glycosyltransferase [Clostridiales bacterium]